MGFTTALERRTSPENPTTNLSRPAAWLQEAFGATPSTSGVRVNEQTAMQFSAVYACVRILAETLAYLPLPVYKRLPRGKERAPDHLNYGLLHDRPNPELTSFNWREIMQSHVALWGNAYAEKEMLKSGKVVALWPLMPNRTRAERRNGRKVIITQPEESGPEVVLGADRVLHIPGLGFNGLNGFSVLGMIRNAVGLGLAAEEFGARFYSNGATVKGVLTHPTTLTGQAKGNIRESFETEHAGLSKSHRLMILEEGMKYERIGIPPEEAQFIQLRKYQKNDICSFFRIPPHMIQDLDRPFQSNVEQMGLDFIRYTMGPWLVRWEQVLNWELFGPDERSTYFAEFNVEGLLRGDSAARAAYYQQIFQVGGISPNEIAEIENFPTVEGGDERFVPMNLVPLSKANALADAQINPPEPEPAPGEEKPAGDEPEPEAERAIPINARTVTAHRRLLCDAAAYFITKEIRAAQTAARKHAGENFVAGFRGWAEDFYADHRDTVRHQLTPVIEAMGCPLDADQRFLAEYVRAIAERHVQTSLGQLDAALETENPKEAVETIVREWDARAGALADEHVTRLGTEIAARQAKAA